MNVKYLFAGLVLAATVLACGCAHDCCRPRPVTTGRPCCPPAGTVITPGTTTVPTVPVTPIPATSGFSAVPATPGGCCN